MPLPKPQGGENRAEFINRCVSDDNVQLEAADSDQALAICSSIWDERSMSPNEKLLQLIKARGDDKPDPFGYGILTADRYTKSMQECVGIDACYKFASTRQTSFDDIQRKAANTLVYSNEGMELTETLFEKRPGINVKQIEVGDSSVELPKNTLLVFRHILTTPRKDRDGDILRTEGAIVDPKLPLLWQHVHTLPIGKMLSIWNQSAKSLELVSVIIDANELCHDAAVMVDDKVLRWSHGFRALEFEELKEEEGRTTSPGGFDVKSFEIMEGSAVSVPSNTDAETQEIILSMVDDGKLTSPLMKSTAEGIREKRPVSVPVKWDAMVTIEGKTIAFTESASRDAYDNGVVPGSASHIKLIEERTDADEPGDRGAEEKGDCSCASEKTDGNGQEAEAIKTESEEVTQADMNLVVAGAAIARRQSERALDKLLKTIPKHSGGSLPLGDEKAGRVISAANLRKLIAVRSDLQDLEEKESDMSRGGKAICESCIRKLTSVIDAASTDESDFDETTAKDAMGVFFAKASGVEREQMLDTLVAMAENDASEKLALAFRALASAGAS